MYFLISFISGILSALPLIFEELHFLSWITMTPLIWICMTKKPLYRYGLLWGIGYYGLLYHWFVELYPFDFMGFTPYQAVCVVIVAWLGMTILQAPEIGLSALLFRLLKTEKYRWLQPVIFASVFTVLEWLQTQTWLGVPYFRLALSQVGCLANIQSASILGSLFVSFLIVLVNGFLALGFIVMFESRSEKITSSAAMDIKKKRYSIVIPSEKIEKKKVGYFRRIGVYHANPYVIIAVCIVLFNYTFGQLNILFSNTNDEDISVAVIQGNVSSNDKWNSSVYETLELYLNLSRDAAEACDPDIILWPETVINVNLDSYSSFKDDISTLAVETEATVFVGTFDRVTTYDEEGNRKIDTYNAVEAFYPDGTISDQIYYKRHLVPFGEYLPMAKFFQTVLPVLANMNAFSDDLTPGDDTNLISTQNGSAGCLVCFDSIYETLSIDSVRDGANFILLSTNDSWYGDSSAVYQHNGHAILRAVENGRYIVRAASTGVSSIISATGEMIDSLGPLEKGYVCGSIASRSNTTIYTYIGNFIVWCCMLICAGIGGYKAVMVIKNSKALKKKHCVDNQ